MSEEKNTPTQDTYILDNYNSFIYFMIDDINYAKSKKKKLLNTNVGKYSITKPYQVKWIKSIIIEYFKSIKKNTKYMNIIDANAGVGGDTISFSKYFSNVYAIEKNNVHFGVLENNINALELNNVNLFHGNFMNIIFKENINNNKNILYMDPPWGGPDYKKHEKVDLEIELDKPNEMFLHDVINKFFKNFDIIILKSPINLNFDKKLFLYKNITQKIDPENKILIIIFNKF